MCPTCPTLRAASPPREQSPSEADGLQDRRHDGSRGEHLLRQLAGCARGGGVIALHGAEAFRGLVHGAEETQASAGRQVVLDAGVLDHAGAPAGQVADGPIAYPSRTRADVRGLGTTELAP